MVVAEVTATVTVMMAAATAGMKKKQSTSNGSVFVRSTLAKLDQASAKSTSALSFAASVSARHCAPADRSLDTLVSSVTLPLLSNLPPLGLHWAALSNQ
jgi:hypothetical protein